MKIINVLRLLLLSPFQARQVLKWRRDKPNQAEKLWGALSATNNDIFDTLEAMNSQYRVSTFSLRFYYFAISFSFSFSPCFCFLFCYRQQRDPLAFNASIKWASERVASAWTERSDNVSI